MNQQALERLKALVRAGRYVDKAWNFSAADSNALLGDPPNWTDYKLWFLGFDSTVDQETKAAYGYPFGKGGNVYLSALRAIASRAAQQGAGNIADAASAVLAEAQQKDQDKASAAGDGPDIEGFNDNHDDKGRFDVGDGGGKEDDAGKGGGGEQKSDWEKSEEGQKEENRLKQGYSKMSDNKLKQAFQFHQQWNGKNQNPAAKQQSRILKQELQKRGIKVFGAAAVLDISAGDGSEGLFARWCAPVTIFAGEDADGKPSGPPTFSMVAYTGGPMRLKGWQFPVVVDLSGMSGLDKPRPALRDHDQSTEIGHMPVGGIRVEDGALHAEGIISGHGPHVDRVVNSSKNQFPWQSSIGAKVIKNEFVPKGRSAQANGRTFEGPINIARRTALGEISFVALGADDNTSARIAAKAAEGSVMTFEQWLEAMGLTLAELSAEQKPKLQAKFDKEQADIAAAAAAKDAECDDDDEDEEDDDDESDSSDKKKMKSKAKAKAKAAAEEADIEASEDEIDLKAIRAKTVKEIRSAHVSETKRIGKIREVCAGGHADIEAKAIEEGWDGTRVELEVLRAERKGTTTKVNGAFGINTGKGGNATPEIIAASAALASGVSEKGALTGLTDNQKEVAASRKIRNSVNSIYGLCSIIASAHGTRLPSPRMDEEVIKHMFRLDRRIEGMDNNLDIQADAVGGYSTMSLSGITENILNKAMLDAYGQVNSLVGDLAYETDTPDFKQFKRYRLTSSGILSALGAAGELKSITLQDESYANTVKTQGVILTVGRDILINDDMGALTQSPTMLGRGAALYREMIMFANILAAPTTTAPGASTGQTANNFNFFSSGAGNFLSGAGSALSINALTSGVQKFREQTDANNMPIMLAPDRLLLPPALEVTGKNLFNGAELVVSALGSTSSKNVEPNINAHKGAYRPIVSPFLSVAVGNKIKVLKGDAAFSNFSSASDTGWYLLPSPAGGFAIVQIGYLRGQRVPIIERGEANFNTLGIAMRCYYDFGVALHDYRCGVFSAGA